MHLLTTTTYLPLSLGYVGGVIHIAAGDFVGVLGNVSSSEAHTLTVSALRDWTLAPLH